MFFFVFVSIFPIHSYAFADWLLLCRLYFNFSEHSEQRAQLNIFVYTIYFISALFSLSKTALHKFHRLALFIFVFLSL